MRTLELMKRLSSASEFWFDCLTILSDDTASKDQSAQIVAPACLAKEDVFGLRGGQRLGLLGLNFTLLKKRGVNRNVMRIGESAQ